MDVLKKKRRKRKMRKLFKPISDFISELFGFHHYETNTIIYHKGDGKITSVDKYCTCSRCGKRTVVHTTKVETPKIYKIIWYDDRLFSHESYRIATSEKDAIEKERNIIKSKSELSVPEPEKWFDRTYKIEEVNKIDGCNVVIDYQSFYRPHIPFSLMLYSLMGEGD